MSDLAKSRTLKAFLARRNRVLGVPFEELVDERRYKHQITIEAFMNENGASAPSTPEAFWRGVHKARTAMTGLAMEERIKSKGWLIAHGSEPLDDGDVPITPYAQSGDQP